MNQFLFSTVWNNHFAGAAQQKYLEKREFVRLLRIDFLRCGTKRGKSGLLFPGL
jgi:hypothetical protein